MESVKNEGKRIAQQGYFTSEETEEELSKVKQSKTKMP